MPIEVSDSKDTEVLHSTEAICLKNDQEIFYVNPFDIPDDYVLTEDMRMTEQDCLDMFATVIKMYDEDKVKIDKAAERFLQRARAVQSSATFQGLMKQAMAIEFEIHKMCGENHEIRAAIGNEYASIGKDDHIGHDHSKVESNDLDVEHNKGCSSERGRACDCKKN